MKLQRFSPVCKLAAFKPTIFLILITVIASSLIYEGSHMANAAHTNQKTIVIDPGHGGVDGGTGNSGLLEKDINLDISKRLKAIFEKAEYKVIMTRDSDIALDNLKKTGRHKRDLNARVGIINRSNADIFLSIHVNSNFDAPSMDGSLVFYNSRNEENKALANHIQHALNSIHVDGKSRTANSPLAGRFYILTNSKISGVLVETAFISNKREKELLNTQKFRQQLAEAIAEGIFKYFKNQNQG